ncbi:MAG: response regulator transcription factor [Bacillaceae bacterium]|nr:response regulator transcription factor [Bacillaceae bacterium]
MLYTFLVVDDSAEAREAISDILSMEPSFYVIGQASGGQQALDFLKQRKADIILMDINMPEMDGFETTRRIKNSYPESTIIMLSVSDDVQDFFEALKLGAQGYLIKNLEPDLWLDYLRSVASGDTPLEKRIALRILKEFTEGNEPSVPEAEQDVLTRREKEILQYVADGYTNRNIAEALSISENTVKNHLKNILQKLHLKNRVQLARYAMEHENRDDPL